MAHCFFELGCEELPSSSINALHQHFERKVNDIPTQFRLGVGRFKIMMTPRRIIIELHDVDEHQQTWTHVIQGPKLSQCHTSDGALSPAANGFLNKHGLTFEEAQDAELGRLVYQDSQGGQRSQALMQDIIDGLFAQLPGIKGMRWGSGHDVFPRPVHWLCALWDGEVLPITLMGLTSANVSYGHRFLAPDAFEVDASRWEQQLLEHYVVADPNKRKDRILSQAKTLLPKGVDMQQDVALLDEVNYLVEWPEVFLGSFDERFLTLPKEVLTLTMNQHQKCFALLNAYGQLQAKFLGVSNLKSRNVAQLIAGNERVMRARLSDALFFYEQDKKHTLISRISSFDAIIDHERLGSMAMRIERVNQIMAQLNAHTSSGFEPIQDEYALCKADLLTETVGELPEVEHLMGYYFAIEEGLPQSLALTIRDHAKPVTPDDQLPESQRAAWISIAERVERIVAFYSVGLPPKSDKDPYGIKRYATGLVRLCVEGSWSFDCSHTLANALKLFPNKAGVSVSAMTIFINERLKTYALSQGVSHDVIQSVTSIDSGNIYDQWLRMKSITQWLNDDEALAFLAVYKRLTSLVKHQHTNGDGNPENSADEEMLRHCLAVTSEVQSHIEQGQYLTALMSLAASHTVWTDYLDHVHIMADDPEVALYRCHLVQLMVKQCQMLADLSFLHLDKAKV